MMAEKQMFRLYTQAETEVSRHFITEAVLLSGAIQELINQSSSLRDYLAYGVVENVESISISDLHEFAAGPYNEMALIIAALSDGTLQKVCIMKVYRF